MRENADFVNHLAVAYACERMDSQKSRDPRCRIYRNSCRPPLCDRACDALAEIRGPQEIGRMVFGVAFGVTFACCSVAALLSFLVSVSLVTYQRFLGVRTVLPVPEADLRTASPKSTKPGCYHAHWLGGADRICEVRDCGCVSYRHSYGACCVRHCRRCAVTNEDSTQGCHPLRWYIRSNRRRDPRVRDVPSYEQK